MRHYDRHDLGLFLHPDVTEVLALLKASPSNLPRPVKEMGGVEEWLWKGKASAREALLDAVVDYPRGKRPLRHVLKITEHGGRFEVADERIENEKPDTGKSDVDFYYRFQSGHPVLNDRSDERRALRRETIKPEARRYRAEMATVDSRRTLDLLAALSHRTDFSVGCYCADETRCHRSLLRELLAERGAKIE